MAVSLRDGLRNLPQYLLPQRLISGATYRLTRASAPWLKDRLIAAFCARFGVDLGEAEQSDPRAYPTFNAFFTRALRAGARPLAAAPDALCSPVDGAVSQAGAIDDDTLLQAKGRRYSLTDLLGGDAARAQAFRGGSFATLYLSPRDYHRIHMPLAGELRAMVYVPGRLFSVSPLTTRVVPRLFARNERLVHLFDTPAGPLALVMVGAINVGSMSTAWAGEITPLPAAQRTTRLWRYDEPGEPRRRFAKGDEIGRFNMGSTVILVFGPGAVSWDAGLVAGAALKMGQAVGQVIDPATA